MFLDLPLSFLFGGVVAGVDDEVVLPGHACLLHVVLEDLFEVQMEAHEVSEGLLAEQALGLHVDLADRLPCKAFGLYDLLPLADPKLHQGQLEDMHLLGLPARGKRVVPQTLGLVVLDLLGHGGNGNCAIIKIKWAWVCI